MSASVSIKGTMETILRLSIPLLHGTQHMRGRRSAEVSVSTGEVLTCCSCCRRELTGRDDNNGLHSCTGRHQSLITASERPAPRRQRRSAQTKLLIGIVMRRDSTKCRHKFCTDATTRPAVSTDDRYHLLRYSSKRYIIYNMKPMLFRVSIARIEITACRYTVVCNLRR